MRPEFRSELRLERPSPGWPWILQEAQVSTHMDTVALVWPEQLVAWSPTSHSSWLSWP